MNNLEIKIAGQSVEIPEGREYILKRKSPLLDKTEVLGDYMEEIDLPFTVNNDRILGHYRNPQVLDQPTRAYCEQSVNSNMMARGFVIPSSAIDSYKLAFTCGLADAFGNLRTKNLNEINFGSISLPLPIIDRQNFYNNSINNTWNNHGYTFPTVENEDFYGGINPENFNGRVNDFATGAYTSSTKVPYFFWKYIAQEIATKVGWTFSGEWWNSQACSALLIDNTYSLDTLDSILIQNHLPTLTVGQFLLQTAILDDVVLMFDVPNRILRFELMDSFLKNTAALDWSSKCQPITGKVPARVVGIELKWNLDADDALAKITDIFYQNYVTPGTDSEAEGLLKFETVWSSVVTSPNGFAIQKKQGITPVNKQLDKKFTPRLVFWNGMVSGYPRATNTLGTKKLQWNGAGGLYQTSWKREERFRMQTFQTPTVKMFLTESDLTEWSPEKKVHINGVNYLFESIDCPLHNLPQGCNGIGWRVW